ncbi:MAG: PilW family protein [Xanthomonadales bacterium]|nr:PilW family protein [Xanthomonadales bacterium]
MISKQIHRFFVYQNGMSLLELLIAMALSSLLTLTLVHMAMAARNSFRLQESLAELQENARFFADLVSSSIADSAYHPEPWLHEATPIGLMPGSADGTGPNSDRLISRSWSEHNCFGTLNSATDSAGLPRFYLKESTLELNSGSLAHSCRYGPSVDAMITQINRQGAVPQVEVFQALYASDTDGDGQIDSWLRAGQWDSPEKVRAVRLGILSSSRESIAPTQASVFQILDFSYTAPADGRLRRVASYTLPLNRPWP